MSSALITERSRQGYSWGTFAALTAPRKSLSAHVNSTFLVSPPLFYFRLLTIFSRSFLDSLRWELKWVDGARPPSGSQQDGQSIDVWLVYGTKDEFTGAERYRAAVKELKDVQLAVAVGDVGSLVVCDIDGASHFFQDVEHGQELERALSQWVISS